MLQCEWLHDLGGVADQEAVSGMSEHTGQDLGSCFSGDAPRAEQSQLNLRLWGVSTSRDEDILSSIKPAQETQIPGLTCTV